MAARDHDPASAERRLVELLTSHPEARVLTLNAEGVRVPLPDNLPIGGHGITEQGSILSFVHPDDRLMAIEGWEQFLQTGAAQVEVRLAADRSQLVRVDYLDLRERYGVLLATLSPTGPGREVGLVEPVIARAAPPRLAKMRKDERAVILAIDDATTQMLGWSAAEMVGRRSLEFIHPDDRDLAINDWMAMLATPGLGYGVRLRHHHRDGSWVWVQVINHNELAGPGASVRSVGSDESGESGRSGRSGDGVIMAELIDVSEEMAAQEALRAREQLLDRLAEALPVGLFQIDLDRRVTYCNDRLTQILGHDARQVMAPMPNVVDEDRDALEAAIAAVISAGTGHDLEVTFERSGDGDRRRAAITLRPLSDDLDTITGAIATVADITDSATMRVELERRATVDELTQCRNRASILDELEQALTAQGEGSGTAVVFIDLDRFKAVNDELGHAAGDEVLVIVANRLISQTRVGDTVGRIGGDEFLVVCPKVASGEEALQVAARLATAASGPISLRDAVVDQRTSIGVAWTDQPVDADTLIAQADVAMYESKGVGAGAAVYRAVRPASAS